MTGEHEAVRLHIADGGVGGSFARGSGGFGLVGMSERALLLGGTLEAGPSPGRGLTVHAVLPKGEVRR